MKCIVLPMNATHFLKEKVYIYILCGGWFILLQHQVVEVVSHYVKHCLDFSFVFSAPLRAWRNLFSARGIFCGERYQPGCTGILRPASLSLFLKGEEISALALHRKRTLVQALPRFSTCSLELPASGTDLKSCRGLYVGPSRIQNTQTRFKHTFDGLWRQIVWKGQRIVIEMNLL